MKKLEAIVKNASGMTLVEVLLSMVIIAVSALAIMMWQKTSWSQTTSTNRLMVAGHIVEKQLENVRMTIAQSPATNFTAFKTGFVNKDSVWADCSVTPCMWVKWSTYDTLHDPKGHSLSDVCQVKLTAWWAGAKKTDTLKLETRIAKNF
jgi:prepilin-type N-terminal cleavage/methylation domain-containing protein